jgi:hypothetical protein
MTRSIGGALDMRALARLAHRPDDPRALRREAENLLAIGFSIADAGQAIGVPPAALAQLLKDHPTIPNH